MLIFRLSVIKDKFTKCIVKFQKKKNVPFWDPAALVNVVLINPLMSLIYRSRNNEGA